MTKLDDDEKRHKYLNKQKRRVKEATGKARRYRLTFLEKAKENIMKHLDHLFKESK